MDGSVDWLNQYSAETLANVLPDSEDDDGGFQTFMESVDAMVMGRHTFQSLIDMAAAAAEEGDEEFAWPYGETPVFILTTQTTKALIEQLPSFIPTNTVSVLSSQMILDYSETGGGGSGSTDAPSDRSGSQSASALALARPVLLDPQDIMNYISNTVPGGASLVYLDGGKTIQRFMEHPDGIKYIHQIIVTEIPITLGEGRPLLTPEQWKRLKLVKETKVHGGLTPQKTYVPII
jgi:dihydrofolate reductase